MITVGETLETTVEDGKKYSGFKEHELNMIFTFEHMNVDNGSNSKWSAERFKLSKLKSIMNRWQMGLQEMLGIVCTGIIMISQELYQGLK